MTFRAMRVNSLAKQINTLRIEMSRQVGAGGLLLTPAMKRLLRS